MKKLIWINEEECFNIPEDLLNLSHDELNKYLEKVIDEVILILK